jgi:hypothetical protein
MRVSFCKNIWICESNNQPHQHQPKTLNSLDLMLAASFDELLQSGIVRPSNIQFCLKQNMELQTFFMPTIKQISCFMKSKTKKVRLDA